MLFRSPACHVQLKNHTISADDNIRLAPEPLQFQWTFNPLILPSEILRHASHVDDELNNLKSSLKTLQNLTISDNQFPDLLSDNLSKVSTFSILLWVTFAIAVASVTVVCCWFGCARKWYFRQRPPQYPPVNQLPNNIEGIAALNLPNAPPGYFH